jgi:hypothetical protein
MYYCMYFVYYSLTMNASVLRSFEGLPGIFLENQLKFAGSGLQVRHLIYIDKVHTKPY